MALKRGANKIKSALYLMQDKGHIAEMLGENVRRVNDNEATHIHTCTHKCTPHVDRNGICDLLAPGLFDSHENPNLNEP